VARRVVGLVAGRGRRVLHDHQAYGRLAGRRRRVVGGVLLRGVFASAVVQDAGDEEDQEQDDIAGDQDDEVEGDGVNLQVEFHETHGAASYLARTQRGGRRAIKKAILDKKEEQQQKETVRKDERPTAGLNDRKSKGWHQKMRWIS